MNGFISIHRKIKEWEWYDDLPVRVLFFECLLLANWRDKNWRGRTIKRGSFITSFEHLAAESGLSVQQTRTALNKLISTNEITKQSGSQFTLIQVVKYEDYQLSTSQATNKQQTSNKRATNEQQQLNKSNNIIKGISKEKEKGLKEKERPLSRFQPPTILEVTGYMKEYAQSKNIQFPNELPEKYFNHYESVNWKVGRNKMKDWQATARNWVLKDGKPIKRFRSQMA